MRGINDIRAGDARPLSQNRLASASPGGLQQAIAGSWRHQLDVILCHAFGVLPCFEIVDSRVRDWRIKLQDTVADNASAGLFVTGRSRSQLEGLDLSDLRMVLDKKTVQLQPPARARLALGPR